MDSPLHGVRGWGRAVHSPLHGPMNGGWEMRVAMRWEADSTVAGMSLAGFTFRESVKPVVESIKVDSQCTGSPRREPGY